MLCPEPSNFTPRLIEVTKGISQQKQTNHRREEKATDIPTIGLDARE